MFRYDTSDAPTLDVEAGMVEAQSGMVEAQSGMVEAQSGMVEAQSGVVEAQSSPLFHGISQHSHKSCNAFVASVSLPKHINVHIKG